MLVAKGAKKNMWIAQACVDDSKAIKETSSVEIAFQRISVKRWGA